MKDNTVSNTNTTIFLGLVIALIFFLFRGAFPFLKYPSILLFTTMLFYIGIAKYKTITITTISYIKQFYLPIIVIIYYFVGILNTSRMYTTLAQEIISHLTLFGGIFLSYFYLNKQNELKHFLEIFNYSVFYLGIVVAIYSLMIFFGLDYVLPDFLREQELIDGNFALIPGFLGVLIVANIAYKRTVVIGNKILFFTTFTLFLLQLVFSSSRRGLFLALIINGIIFLLITYSLLKKNIFIKRIGKVLQLFLISSLLSLTLVVGIYKVPSTFKNKFLINAGIPDTEPVKYNIALVFFKLSTIFDVNANFIDIYTYFWSSTLDSKDPDTGWGTGMYEKVFPLSGTNVEIIPNGAIGIKLDRISVKLVQDTIADFSSLVYTAKFNGATIINTSIYCYVSHDFNGNWVSLKSLGAIDRIKQDDYYLIEKGKWQKLATVGIYANEYMKFVLSFGKKNVFQIADLEGEVLFAYPEYEMKDVLDLDPNDPQSGWGYGNYTSVYPIIGTNSKIVPESAIGYALGKHANVNYIESGQYASSSSIVGVINAKVKRKYIASIYCYVSDEFSVDGSQILTHASATKERIINKTIVQKYDFSRKSEWQKLEIQFTSQKDGIVPIQIWVYKKGVKDFSTLDGNVIFAYPTWEEVQPNANQTPIDTNQTTYQIHHNDWSKTSNRAGLLCYLDLFMKMLQTVPTTDNDYIRNKVADLVSEDSTYYPYKADITVDSVGRDLGQDRLIRWKFALDLFVKEYTWKEKIFGGGFDFLGWYGKVFKGDHMKPDYPHNPFLHILLYGGIVGLSLYFWLLARVLQLYWRYRKEYGIFLLMWGVVYYFTLFSGGDPFNPPVMGFFMLLPFLIHAVHQREAKE